MKIVVTCGKGGVGKSTSAGALAHYYSSIGLKTRVIDTDGGQSMQHVLGAPDPLVPANTFNHISDTLKFAVIDPVSYRGIFEIKESGGTFGDYMDQFPADLGIVPLADMMNTFFGVPTDTYLLQGFALLVALVSKASQESADVVIIDVEPTAGLQRLLIGIDSTTRSLRNLQSKGKTFLLAVGAAWPDIAQYLKSDYIRQADFFASRMQELVDVLRGASYLAVCIPEIDPILQTYKNRALIEATGGTIAGYIVNNTRGEPSEADAIAHLPSDRPRVHVRRIPGLHTGDRDVRRNELTRAGQTIHSMLKLAA